MEAGLRLLRRRKGRGPESVFRAGLSLSGFLPLLILLGIVAVLWRASGPARGAFGLRFFWGRVWDPVHEVFGALPFVYGTIVTSVLAVLFGVPVALGSALFVVEIAPRRVRSLLTPVLDLLAGVPSVVYGLWGMFYLVPFLSSRVEPLLRRAFGFSPLFSCTGAQFNYLAGGVILSVMILPTVASICREVFLAVPTELKEGAMALGATRWDVVRMVTFPVARGGVIGAIFLGLARALGETMAVTMVVGNRPEISACLFAPGYTAAAALANEFTEAAGDVHLASLVYLALALMFVTFLVNLIARLLVWKVTGGEERGLR